MATKKPINKRTPEQQARFEKAQREKRQTRESITRAIIRNESIIVFGRRAIKLYATEVNLDRAVPDVVDGLKPVQRKIAYAASLFPRGVLQKAAAVTGRVMGEFHPHADCYQSVVTMVNASVPLIYGEGNWGTLVDNAAASRYTNCRLTKFAEYIFDKDYMNDQVTSFVPNYADTTTEPVTLPVPLPNILLNGGEGIGVGITCKLPTFTHTSVVAALTQLLEGEKLKALDFAKILKPSFKYGGQMVKTKANSEAYKEMFTSPEASVLFESPLEVDEAKRTIIVSQWVDGMDPNKLIPKVRLMPECQYSELHSGTTSYIIQMKKGYNVEQFRAWVLKVQKLTHVKHAFKLNVTRRTATIKDGIVDYEVALLSLSVPQLLVTWLRARLETEVKSLNYRIAKQQLNIDYSKLLIHAASPANLQVMFQALKLKGKDPIAFIAKGMKVSLDSAKTLWDLKFRQLSNLDVDAQKTKLKEQEAHMRQLQLWLKKPKTKVLLDVKAASDMIDLDVDLQHKSDTQKLTAI